MTSKNCTGPTNLQIIAKIICMNKYVHTYIGPYKYACSHRHIHAYIHIHIHTYTYIYTHTWLFALYTAAKKKLFTKHNNLLCYIVINYIVSLALRQHKCHLKWQKFCAKHICKWSWKMVCFQLQNKSQNEKVTLPKYARRRLSATKNPGLRHLRKSALHVFSVYLSTGFHFWKHV